MRRFVLSILFLSVALSAAQMNHSMTPVTDEYSFIAGMIPHHQEAVDTAQVILERSERPELRRFAETMVEVQSEEIELLKAWLAERYPDATTDVMYMPMMRDQTEPGAEELEQFFLEDMIMHHRIAVDMSQVLLENDYAQNPDVAELAQGIIDTQEQEIMMMSAWLKDWYGVDVTPMDMDTDN